MAINKTFEEEEDKGVGAQEEEQDINALKAPVPAGGAPQGGQSVGTAPKPTSSGSFTNLQKFISANKPKIQRQGQQTAERLGGEAEAAKSEFDTTTAGLHESIEGSTLQGTDQFTGGKGLAEVTESEEWKKYMPGSQWEGKTQEEIAGEFKDPLAKLGRAVTNVEGTGTQAGLARAVQTGKEGAYDRGLSTLNAALMGRGKETQAALGALRDKYKGSEEAAKQAQRSVTGHQEQAKARNLQQQQRFMDWVGSKGGQLESGLEAARRTADIAQAARERTAELSKLTGKSPEILENELMNIRNEEEASSKAILDKQLAQDPANAEKYSKEHADRMTELYTKLMVDPIGEDSRYGDIAGEVVGEKRDVGYGLGGGATAEQRAAYEALSKIYGETDSTQPFEAEFDQARPDFYQPSEDYDAKLREYIRSQWANK
jgi:hypothetical protein